MVTQLGKKLRVLRMDKGELLKDMALKLNLTSSNLSAIEFGDKNVPKDFLVKLLSQYGIPASEIIDWEKAIDDSKLQVKINLQEASMKKRTAALTFAREFENVDDDLAERILELFETEVK